jgi:hypothetical protein
MFIVGQLVWILSSDESGIAMTGRAPVLIIAKYVGVPRAFLYNDEANDTMVGREEKIVYDILCDGIVDCAVDEDWLGILTDEEIEIWMSASL